MMFPHEQGFKFDIADDMGLDAYLIGFRGNAFVVVDVEVARNIFSNIYGKVVIALALAAIEVDTVDADAFEAVEKA